jgi:hypothetical protein
MFSAHTPARPCHLYTPPPPPPGPTHPLTHEPPPFHHPRPPPHARFCAGIWYREWAPGAKALALVGEFNNWEPRQQDWAIKNEYGVWCLFMPDNPDGSSAIPHRCVVPGGVWWGVCVFWGGWSSSMITAGWSQQRVGRGMLLKHLYGERRAADSRHLDCILQMPGVTSNRNGVGAGATVKNMYRVCCLITQAND